MSWKDRMNAGIGEYLRSIGFNVVEVLSIEDSSYVYVYSDGDYDLELETTIRYRDSSGKEWPYYVSASFADFINNIT